MKKFWTKLASAAVALIASAGLSFAIYQTNIDGIGLGSTTAPALTSCGTTPAIVGTDLAGTVTMGTTATGCVITFNSAKSAAPHCVVTWIATPLASQSYVTSATAITLTQTSASNNVVKYICIGI
jgi:hypothetical protein